MRRAIAIIAAALALTGCNYSNLNIPGLIDAPIVSGGQDELDAGHVVDLTGWCIGYNGLHIGGHYSTHGSAFGQLPGNLHVGDTVTIYSTEYTVAAVDQLPDCGGVWGDAILQTSAGPGMMVWHLTLSSDTPAPVGATVDTPATRLNQETP